MRNPYQKILALLKANNIQYEELEHEPVFTSEEAAKVRGVLLRQGAKSLLLKTKEKFILLVIPGDKKLDSKRLRQLLSVKDIRFATPEEIKEVMGCEIGACYPIGTIINIKPIVDASFAENEIISFNPGVHNKSIKIKWDDYRTLVDPQISNIIQ